MICCQSSPLFKLCLLFIINLILKDFSKVPLDTFLFRDLSCSRDFLINLNVIVWLLLCIHYYYIYRVYIYYLTNIIELKPFTWKLFNEPLKISVLWFYKQFLLNILGLCFEMNLIKGCLVLISQQVFLHIVSKY